MSYQSPHRFCKPDGRNDHSTEEGVKTMVAKKKAVAKAKKPVKKAAKKPAVKKAKCAAKKVAAKKVVKKAKPAAKKAAKKAAPKKKAKKK